jgi:proteasome lid subunit RPN8/RPN11
MTSIHGIVLSDVHANVMRDAAVAGYPEEICGILVGSEEAGTGKVSRVVPTRNASDEGRARRYEIPPADLVHEQRTASEQGLRLLGFYHSHPDHPAVPSDHDLERAWSGYVYVIVPVQDARAGAPRAWHLAGDPSRFTEVALQVERGATRWV